MKLRTKMFIYIGIPSILIIFLSILFISVISSTKISRELDTTLKSRNEALTEQVSELVMTSAKSYIRAIGSVTNRNLTRIHNSYKSGLITEKDPLTMINNYLRNEDFLENGYIYLVDSGGTIVSHPDRTRIGSDSISKEWLLSKETMEEEFFNYNYGGRSKVLYKLFNESLGLYILTTAFVDDFSYGLDYDELRRVMDKVKIQDQGYPIIISSRGEIIYHKDKQLLDRNVVNVKDAYGTYIFKRILRERNGNFKYFWKNKRGIPDEMFIYYKYDKNSGFTICTTGSVRDYFTLVDDLVKTVLIALSIIIFVTAFLMFKLSNSLSNPIVQLSRASREFESLEEELSIRGIVTEEIKNLYISFNQMRRSIREKIQELSNHRDNLEETILKKTDELKKAQDQLIESEKMSSLGGLVTGIAHEINTPVGIGVTTASHIEMQTNEMIESFRYGGITKTALEDYLLSVSSQSGILLTNMQKAGELITSFKQIAVDQASHEKRLFNLKEYLDEIAISLKHEYSSNNISLEINCDQSVEVESYPGALSQIVTQLVMNSINHGLRNKKNGRIDILVLEKRENIILEVKDNGEGISQNILPKIFDPFFTTNRQAGIGLGLHQVYNQVNHVLKGDISCNSNNYRTIFSVSFPRICIH